MNTNGLANYYDCFSPWERMSLMVAASARGDEVELARLAGSAPMLSCHVADCWGLLDGLDDLAKLYMLQQLDLAGFYWRLEAFLEQDAVLCDTKGARNRDERLWKLAQTLASCFVVRADGWKLLCAELHIDPDVLLRKLPGYESIRQMEEVARLVACTPEQALANLRETAERNEPAKGEAPARAPTAEDVARCMREFLDERLDRWSGPR